MTKSIDFMIKLGLVENVKMRRVTDHARKTAEEIRMALIL